MYYKEILSRFKIQNNGVSKAQCICPCHNDKQASLTISQGMNHNTLIHCHGGCDINDILQKVGLTFADLYEDTKYIPNGWREFLEQGGKRKIERVYHYVSFFNGSYSYTKIRYVNSKSMSIGRFVGEVENSNIDLTITKGNESLRAKYPYSMYGDLKGIKQAIQDGEYIYIVEGEKDVDTLVKMGYPACTYGSSESWYKELGECFKDARIILFIDNDRSGRKVADAIKADTQGIAKELYIIVPMPDKEHGDITDFVEQGHTREDIEKLIQDTVKKKECVEMIPAAGEEELNLEQFHIVNDKGGITGVYDFAILEYLKSNVPMFIMGNTPYIYKGGVYARDDSGAELKTMIRNLILPKFIKSGTIKRIYDLFLSDAELQTNSSDLNNYPEYWVNFLNGFYDVKKKKMINHEPKYMAINQIPHVFDPEQEFEPSIITEWLNDSLESEEDVMMLIEYAGYCMTTDVSLQKMMIICGEGGTGKSTLIRLMNALIGNRNISSISLNQLTQRFFSYGLIGKLMNSCADLEIDALSDTSTLKKILGEDSITAESKGKDAISFMSYAKLIFSTNELPIVKAERTNGFFRRLLILNMNKQPLKKEARFIDKLLSNINEFIQLAIQGLEVMYSDGYITESEGSKKAVKRLRCDSDTVEAWLNECTINEGRIKKLDAFNNYERYCDDMERQALKKNNFYRAMKVKGYNEVIYHGEYCFKNITLFHPKSSPDEFMTVSDEKIPFD